MSVTMQTNTCQVTKSRSNETQGSEKANLKIKSYQCKTVVIRSKLDKKEEATETSMDVTDEEQCDHSDRLTTAAEADHMLKVELQSEHNDDELVTVEIDKEVSLSVNNDICNCPTDEDIEDFDINNSLQRTSPNYVDYPAKKTRTKKSKKQKQKSQGKKKRWKHISSEELGFELSLFSWRPVNDTDVTIEMELELTKFEELCAKDQKQQEENNQDTKTENTTVCLKDENICSNNRSEKLCDIHYELEEYCFLFDELDTYTWLESKTINLIETYCGNIRGGNKRLRAKKKWRVMKARKQIKTKQCREVTNMHHGATYCINHRVHKQIAILGCYRVQQTTSIRQIDRRWDRWQKEEGFSLRAKSYTTSTRNQSTRTGANTTGDPIRRSTQSTHMLNAYNADGELTADLVNILMRIQERDLTPEDYDLLLRLDERVEAKTVPTEVVAKFRTKTLTESPDEPCAICLEEYEVGQIVKYLPCGHGFHEDCTIQWLQTSTTCPLDGLEVES